MAARRNIKLTLELTDEINDFLDEEAETTGTTKSDVLRKALALMKTASVIRQRGQELAVIDAKSEQVVARIVGLSGTGR